MLEIPRSACLFVQPPSQLSNGQVDLVLSPSAAVPGWFINYTALSRLAESSLGPDYAYSAPRWALTASAYPLACTQLAAGMRVCDAIHGT
jgi:hypothetical protein